MRGAWGVVVLAAALGLLTALGASLHDRRQPLAPAPGVDRGAPVPDPGAPGPYAVGVTFRTATPVLANGDRRDVGYWVWYPTAPGGVPLWGLGAVLDAAPLTSAPRPVIVVSHGHTAQPSDYRAEIAHLASHGFVVVGPLHRDCANCSQENSSGSQNLRRVGDVSAVLDDLIALGARDDTVTGL